MADDLSAPLGQSKKRRSVEDPGRRARGDHGGARLFPRRLRAVGGGGQRPHGRRTGGGGRDCRTYGTPAEAGHRRRQEARRRGCRDRPPAPPPAGTQTVTIIDGSSGKPQDDPGSGERRRPRRRGRQQAPGERRATARFPASASTAPRRCPSMPARPAPIPPRRAGPRIALVVGGLGISATTTGEAHRQAARPGDLRVRPLWHRHRPPGRPRPRRRARSAAAGADGAVRLSRQRSRAADAAHVACRRTRTSTACTG